MTTITLMSERNLQDTVIEMAKVHGWLVNHQRPARTDKGWRTAVEGHAGFFDLVLARPAAARVREAGYRPPRLLFVELKTARGRLSPMQRQWHETIAQLPYVERAIWTPDDLYNGRIEKALT